MSSCINAVKARCAWLLLTKRFYRIHCGQTTYTRTSPQQNTLTPPNTGKPIKCVRAWIFACVLVLRARYVPEVSSHRNLFTARSRSLAPLAAAFDPSMSPKRSRNMLRASCEVHCACEEYEFTGTNHRQPNPNIPEYTVGRLLTFSRYINVAISDDASVYAFEDRQQVALSGGPFE